MISLVLALLLAQPGYSPDEAKEIFRQATEAHGRQEFAAARANFEKLLAQGLGSEAVLYNLGTTCLAAGDLGCAVLHLERAARMRSGASDVAANLAAARTRQLDQVVGGNLDTSLWERLLQAIPVLPLGAGLLGASWVGWGLLLWARFRPVGRRAGLQILGVLALGLASAGGALAWGRADLEETLVEGVVTVADTGIREVPSRDAKVSFELHAGLKVRLLDESGPWIHLRLPNGLEGWAEREGVTRL